MKVIDAPKYKNDWVGSRLALKENCIEGGLTPLPQALTVRITRRMNARETMHSAQDVSRWGEVRILKCIWKCPACEAMHSGYLPESWIEEGKAFFIERKY